MAQWWTRNNFRGGSELNGVSLIISRINLGGIEHNARTP